VGSIFARSKTKNTVWRCGSLSRSLLSAARTTPNRSSISLLHCPSSPSLRSHLLHPRRPLITLLRYGDLFLFSFLTFFFHNYSFFFLLSESKFLFYKDCGNSRVHVVADSSTQRWRLRSSHFSHFHRIARLLQILAGYLFLLNFYLSCPN